MQKSDHRVFLYTLPRAGARSAHASAPWEANSGPPAQCVRCIQKKTTCKKSVVLITFPWKCHTRTTGFLARHQISFFGHFYLVKHDTCGMLPSTLKCIEKPEKTHVICDGQKCKIPSLMNFLSTSYTWGIWSDHSVDHLAFTTKTPLFNRPLFT